MKQKTVESRGGKKHVAPSVPVQRRTPCGFDAAVSRQEDDHLNRWPFALEVYRAATTGPREWSVRVGVYGEWGTGKTSVLRFAESIAKADGHIVVHFNPWEYADRDAMWRAFILAVYRELGATLGKVTGANKVRAKGWVEKISGWPPSCIRHAKCLSGNEVGPFFRSKAGLAAGFDMGIDV
jgi:hypothetical protein